MPETKFKTGPQLSVAKAPLPEESDPGTQYQEISQAAIEEAVERRLAQERRRPKAAPSPDPTGTGLWALIPKAQRPWVVIALLFLGGGSGSWLLNLSAIWSLPGEVQELKSKIDNQEKQLQEIKALLTSPTSRPGR
jgi:hypothetical protein